MEIKFFKIVTTQSNIDWVGRKVTGAHNGTIAVKEDEIVLTGGKLTVVSSSSIPPPSKYWI